MAAPEFLISKMSRDDFDLVLRWAAELGWNPGKHDAECFYNSDPNGFLIGRLGEDPIASISVIKYGSSYGFLGFYIVRQQFRKQGYGLRMWKAGMEYMKGRIVGLDAVVAQQANYTKSGFHFAHRNLRYKGLGKLSSAVECSDQIVSLASVNFEKLLMYDSECFPEEREKFLCKWISLPESNAVGVIRGDDIVGYGVIRRSESGFRIGPLFADSANIAEAIFVSLLKGLADDDEYYIDVPLTNKESVAIVEKHGLIRGFETGRMYFGGFPSTSIAKVFGLSSVELG